MEHQYESEWRVALKVAEIAPNTGMVPVKGCALLAAQAEIERLRADLKAMEGFADLWYFVSDEAPLDFEKIVAEYSPRRWLTEAHKLRAAKRGA